MRMIWAASLPGTRLAAATGADGAEPMRTDVAMTTGMNAFAPSLKMRT